MPTLVFFRAPPAPLPLLAIAQRSVETIRGTPVVLLPKPFALPEQGTRDIVLGRDQASCDVHLDDQRYCVSRRHLVLVPADGGWLARDVGRNGTHLNGTALPKDQPAPLTPGDTLHICGFHFLFADDRRSCAPEPSLPQRFESEWRTEHTVGLAGRMHDERDYAALPILADALEEAGCDNQDILTHCRDWPTHDTDCWVVRRVLGLESNRDEMLAGDFDMV